MLACLSPNGSADYRGGGILRLLKVGTIEGVYTLRRNGASDVWEVADCVHPEWPVSSLALEPRSRSLFAGVHGGGGLWRSADGGQEWERIGRQMPSHVYSIQVQHIGERARIWVGVEPASLFVSEDLGETWTECSALKSMPGHEKWIFPPPPHIAHVKGVAWHDSAPDTLFVLVEQGGLFKTTDAGRTFVELTSYLAGDEQFYRDSHRVRIAPGDPKLIYFATGDGLCRSTDGGDTWKYVMTKEGPIGYPDALFIDPRNGEKIVLGGPKSAPRNWRETQHAAATVMVSLDRGDTWRQMATGMNGPLKGNIEAMASYVWDGGVAYLAGTATGEVFLSENGCESWTLVLKDLPPISKAGHYRWFLTDAQREVIEERMRRWKSAV